MARIIVPLPEDAFDKRPYLEGDEQNGFHCGEVIEVQIGSKWFKFRWELDDTRGWFVTDGKVSFIPLRMEGREAR